MRVFIEITLALLLLLLLIRSINHDKRMERLEKFVGKLAISIRQRESLNAFDAKEVDTNGGAEGSDSEEQR